MHIDSIHIEDFRTFRKTRIDFVNAGTDFEALGMPAPRLQNVNLLLGNNGAGKTTLLKAIALAALGPAVSVSGMTPYRLIRREPEGVDRVPENARIHATFSVHPQDHSAGEGALEASLQIIRKGDLEVFDFDSSNEQRWKPVYSNDSDAFFVVGYGATRRVEKRDVVDPGSRSSTLFVRAQRIQSLFEEAYSLLPLSTWLPRFQSENPGRYKQAVNLLNRLIGASRHRFTEEFEGGEYLYEKGGLKVPFPALSDGYRAYIGWIGDLIYHICSTAPSGKKLVENQGIVMVDEIDLHLHPKWQMTVLETLAKELPNIQFIVTSHSPLVVGSLEWMNIILMKSGDHQSSKAVRNESAVYGLDADQVLLSSFFGLDSTRAPGAAREMKHLSARAGAGDSEAALTLLAQMSRGIEPVPNGNSKRGTSSGD